ncbi:hypothetical protein BH09MYX1_BH09MYX1_50930 [soil metagenome]
MSLRNAALLVLPLALLSPMLASCKKAVGDLRTLDLVSDATGNPSAPAKVVLSLSAGELHLVPGGAHTLGGSVRSNVKDLDPKVEESPGKVSIGQGKGDVDVNAITGEVVADWRLTAGPTPLDLTIDAKAAKVALDLSALAMKSITVRTTVGAVDVVATKPNPMVADILDIETFGGAITLHDVGNVNAAKVRVKTSAGALTVDMGTTINREIAVDLEAGSGSISITMPDTGALAILDGGCAVKATGWDKVADGKYAVRATWSPR